MKNPLCAFVGSAMLLLASPVLAGARDVQVSPTHDARLVTQGFESLVEWAPRLQNDSVGVATAGLGNSTDECILWDGLRLAPEPSLPLLTPERALTWAWMRAEAPDLILDGVWQRWLRAPMLP